MSNLCKQWESSSTKISFYAYDIPDTISGNKKEAIYRIVQELLFNALKHASPTHIIIQLEMESDKLKIYVEDNGAGFEEKKGSGIGLKNIESRIQSMNGTWTLESQPGDGTRFELTIPVSLKPQDYEKMPAD